MQTKIKILSELKIHLLENFGNGIKEVILFGSNAWGNANKYSDYDVLIILKGAYSGKDENKILDLCYDIGIEYNIIIDAHILSDKEISSLRGKQPIFKKAIKSGIYA